MRRIVIAHPFLFAIYPILSLYVYNVDRASPYEMLIPALLGLVLTSALFLLTKSCVRNYDKAGVITSLVVVFFFSYGHIFNAFLIRFYVAGTHIGRERYMLPAYLFFSAATIYLALLSMNRSQVLSRITQFMNVMATVLIALCLGNLIKPLASAAIVKEKNILSASENVSSRNSLPDIYYIILDMYASSRTLKDIYGYDNTDFTRFLESKGFYVAYKSHSNYGLTDLSLASSLNMEYLDDYRAMVGGNKKDRTILLKKIKNSRVSQILKLYGYRHIHFCSGYGVTKTNPHADANYCSGGFFTEYLKVLIDTTVLASVYSNYIEPNIIRNRVMYAFEELPKIPDINGPKFVFVHLPVPHYPYVFGQNGEKMSPLIRTNDKGRYLDQLIYVNKRIPSLINEILDKSEKSPVIIIQSDHGPDNTGSFINPTDMFIKERFNILNAYYFPGKGNHNLYRSISPVNSFRVMFNLYFGTKLELLRDSSYISKYEDLYNFEHISKEKLEYN